MSRVTFYAGKIHRPNALRIAAEYDKDVKIAQRLGKSESQVFHYQRIADGWREQAVTPRLTVQPYTPPQPEPSRKGSRHCRSGSIASGGTREYCTCDTCF